MVLRASSFKDYCVIGRDIMLQVQKRSGDFVPFDLKKIESAIGKAFAAEHKEVTPDVLELLALRVTSNFSNKVKNEIVTVEDIQDSVEVVLIQTGFVDVASLIWTIEQKELLLDK